MGPLSHVVVLQGAFILSRSLAVVKSHSFATCAPELLPQTAYVASFMTVDSNQEKTLAVTTASLLSLPFLPPPSFSNFLLLLLILLL